MYNVKSNGTKEGTDSMVSVSLDEEDAELPGYVEHDGTGRIYYIVLFIYIIIVVFNIIIKSIR